MDTERYLRIDAIPFIKREKLESSLAIVGGAGALGNEIAKCLAMLGFGRVLLVDRDTIEKHNVTRSVLLGLGGDLDAAIARSTPKAEYVADGMRTLNPHVRVAAWVGDAADLGVGIFQRADVVFSAFDNMLARYIFMKRCAESGRSLVDGGLGNNPRDVCQGEVVRYDAGAGACLACRLGAKTREGLAEDLLGGGRNSCGINAVAVEQQGGVPSTPMMASIIGGAQVLTAIKALMGDRRFPAPSGVPMRLDLTGSPSMPAMKLRRDPDCPFHAPHMTAAPAATIPLGATSDKLTLVELAREAEGRLGPGAVVWLPTNMATDVFCTACSKGDQSFVMWNRAHLLTCRHCGAGPVHRCTSCGQIADRKSCAACGGRETRLETPVSATGASVSTYSLGDEVRADKTLRELGLPVLHVYEVTSADASRREWLEPQGDFEQYFTFKAAKDAGARA